MLALWCKSEWEKGKTWLRSKKLVTWGDLMPTGDISIAKRNLHNDKVLPFYPAVSLGSPICCGSYGLSIIDWVNWETFFKTLLMWPRLMMIQTQCYLMIGRWDGGRATGWRGDELVGRGGWSVVQEFSWKLEVVFILCWSGIRLTFRLNDLAGSVVPFFYLISLLGAISSFAVVR